jgi:GNAT superfamily N-acetyltransferase
MVMADNLDVWIGELGPDEHPQLFEFYSATLPAAERIRALYEWRLSDPAASGGIRTTVARTASGIVGAISLVPLEFGVGQARILGAWHADTVVATSYRGTGIGKRIVNASTVGLPLVAAKGTQPVMYALRKRIGFQDVPNSNYLVRVLAPISAKGSIRRRLALPVMYALTKLRRPVQSTSSLRTRVVSAFNQDFDRLCEAISAGPEITPVKTARYLNWRYIGCPGRSYLIIRAEDSRGRPRGAVVIRPNHAPYTDAWIVDMIAPIDDQQAQHALLNTCFDELRGRKASSVRTFATSPIIRATLAARGFRDLAHTPRFTYRVETPLPLVEGAAWNCWHGDADNELHS